MGSVLKINKTDFCREVMQRVFFQGRSYVESVIEVCELHDIEPDAAPSLLTKEIKNKIKEEATYKRNYSNL